MDSPLENPLPENWNAGSWNSAGDQRQNSYLTKEKRQSHETLSLGQHTIENLNPNENLGTSPTLPEAAFMHYETRIKPDYQPRDTQQLGQPIQNEYGAPNMGQYFPPFRGECAAGSAHSVDSTTAVQTFTVTTPEAVLDGPNSSQITGAQAETDQSLLSREHGEVAARLSNCSREGGSDALVLASYTLEGFRHAKVWLHNPEECPHCDEEFATLASLREHIKRTHRNTLNNLHKPIEKVKCQHCDVLLMNENNLRRHVANVHSLGNAKIACVMCSAFFTSPFSAITHMRDIHGIQPPSRQRTHGVRKKKKVFFRCETCGYCSKEKSNVTRHVKSAHVRKKDSEQG